MAYSYNSKIVNEQGGSKLTVRSGGSFGIDVGGAGSISGTVTVYNGASVIFKDGASLNFAGTPAITFGNTTLLFGTDIPTAITASPGAVYFRSDGSISNIYVNTSSGTSGSVWKGASIFN